MLLCSKNASIFSYPICSEWSAFAGLSRHRLPCFEFSSACVFDAETRQKGDQPPHTSILYGKVCNAGDGGCMTHILPHPPMTWHWFHSFNQFCGGVDGPFSGMEEEDITIMHRSTKKHEVIRTIDVKHELTTSLHGTLDWAMEVATVVEIEV